MPVQILSVPNASGSTSVAVGQLDMDIETDRLMIGQGFNSAFAEQGMLNTVIYEGVESLTEVVGAKGQDVEYVLKSVTDYSELKKTLNISASASLGIGIYSGGAAMSLDRSESHTRLDTFLLVGVKVRNPSLILKHANLSPGALKILSKSRRAFIQQCGNTYVYGVVTGGEMLGVQRYTATSDEQAQTLRIQVRAAAAGYGSGNFSMSQAVSSVTSHTSTDFTLVRRGGGGDIPDADALIAAAQSFPDEMRDINKARIIAVYVRGYNTVENLPVHSLDLSEIQEQARQVEMIANRVSDLYEARNEWLMVRGSADQFEFEADPVETVNGALAIINTVIEEYAAALRHLKSGEGYAFPALGAIPTPPKFRAAPEPPPVVTVYRDINFGGASYSTSEEVRDFSSIEGGLNDEISSIKIRGNPGEYLVQLFQHADYQGIRKTIMSPAEIGSLHGGFPDWSKLISSLIITKVG